MSSTSSFVCAVRPDGKVECWGKNQAGQVGLTDDTTGAPIDPVYTPTVVGGLPECVAVAAGETTSCALCGGSIYCWGSNRRGTLGAGALTALPVALGVPGHARASR
jgi:serine/threonine-protein kinase